MLNGFIGRMGVDKVHGRACHGWEAEMMKHVVVVMDIGLAGVEHHAVAVKNDGAGFLVCDHRGFSILNTLSGRKSRQGFLLSGFLRNEDPARS